MAAKRKRTATAAPRRKSAKSKSGAAVHDSSPVLLRFLHEPPAALPLTLSSEQIRGYAQEWSYRLRDRRRWATRESATIALREQATRLAATFGITPAIVQRVGRTGIIQVDLCSGDDPLAVALATLPWEYMLAAATRPLRGDSPFAVVRRLRDGKTSTRSARRWLMIQSAPGSLHESYDFQSEWDILQRNARACEATPDLLDDPTATLLQRTIADNPYELVHLAGFDVRDAADRLDEAETRELLSRIPSNLRSLGGLYEGYVLTTEAGNSDPIEAHQLAAVLCAGPVRPKLVTCNIYNSAYHIGRALVAAGAESAVGFQDTFDDALAEEFFATFFRAWCAAEWNSISAFAYAWGQIRTRRAQLQGSGIVLWTSLPLGGTQLINEEAIRNRTSPVAPLTEDNVRDFIEVRVIPFFEVNYSILHNNGPLFRKFVIRKKNSNLGQVADLQVKVQLYVGTDTYPFRKTVDLGYSQQQCDLAHEVRVSLASTLNRALRENVRTSLFVQVKWRGVTLHNETYGVTLLSVDEWRDDDLNRKWLPSFVLPRDPIVLQIIDRAQRYLMALQDDPNAGFDGYQSADPGPRGKLPANACECVDLQVRAIWSALIYDMPLSYINPPPTFTDSSQRLRTPSDVVTGKHGTCIDLALLLASCLEYVDIYPTVILLKTHAFPAYWRHSVYHDYFSQTLNVGVESIGELTAEHIASSGQTYSWYFDRPDHYREILGAVEAGKLVPLETVSLTARAAFLDALDQGQRNLGNKREFDAMLDIRLARSDEQWRVTPLPIIRREA